MVTKAQLIKAVKDVQVKTEGKWRLDQQMMVCYNKKMITRQFNMVEGAEYADNEAHEFIECRIRHDKVYNRELKEYVNEYTLILQVKHFKPSEGSNYGIVTYRHGEKRKEVLLLREGGESRFNYNKMINLAIENDELLKHKVQELRESTKLVQV